MNINVPLELHNNFKAATAARGENMTDVILKLMAEYVARYSYDSRPQKERRK